MRGDDATGDAHAWRGARAEWTSDDGVWLCREYDAQALAQRPRPPIGRAALRDMAADGGRVTLVWKREGRHERPWVMVAPSAVLRGIVPVGGDAGVAGAVRVARLRTGCARAQLLKTMGMLGPILLLRGLAYY